MTQAFPQLYPHQVEAVEKAKLGNVVVNIRTGGGKTLIAVRVADHFLARCGRSKKVLFVVPTRALVDQQAQYCRQHCSPPATAAELSGNDMELWSESQWRTTLRQNDVLVGTAEVFRRALVDKAYIRPEDFCLVVLDECHNATGNSPMASIMRDSIGRCDPSIRPRVLGLTASFVNGSLAQIEKKRRGMEELLLATLISPKVPEHLQDNAYILVPFVERDLAQYKDPITALACQALDVFPPGLVDDPKKVVNKCVTVFNELGRAGLSYFVKEGIVKQLEAKTEELASNPACAGMVTRINSFLAGSGKDVVKTRLKAVCSAIDEAHLPELSHKFEALLALLQKLHAEHKGDLRGIVFVKHVAVSYPLAQLINVHVATLFANGASATYPVSVPVSGVGSMADSTRNQHLDLFRNGKVKLLVATNALEEGIDVPECGVVLRYEPFDTTKSHIQGSGRARKANARVFYFENDPQLEVAKARHVDSVARNDSLKCSKEELVSAAERFKTEGRVVGVHPFTHPGTGAEVSLLNCIPILYEYCQQVMGQSFHPDEVLYDVRVETVRVFPPEERRTIQSVRYPSPDGWQVVDAAKVDAHWGNVDVNNLLPAERTKNLTAWDFQKRRFVYVAVLDMIQRQYLNTVNQATPGAQARTRQACASVPMISKISIKNKFSPSSLSSTSSTTPSPGKSPSLTSSTASTSSSPSSVSGLSSALFTLLRGGGTSTSQFLPSSTATPSPSSSASCPTNPLPPTFSPYPTVPPVALPSASSVMGSSISKPRLPDAPQTQTQMRIPTTYSPSPPPPASAPSLVGNSKGRLQEILQKQNPMAPTGSLVLYVTSPVGPSGCATRFSSRVALLVPPGGAYAGEVCASKKDAEQSAAGAALRALGI